MTDYILEMNHITKMFSGVKALEDVNLKVRRGEIHALCGENGAGKSTLMNVLSGIYPYGAYSGDILYDGDPVKNHSIRDSEKKGIVIIHQELALSPYLSIGENIFLGNEQTRGKGVIDWTKTRRNAREMLEKVGLSEDVDVPVNTLGVGKQQLIEIAKALAKKVNLLILDEPTAALNDQESAQLLEIIQNLKTQGITCILISHKLSEISAIADSITILRDGHTIETLTKEEDAFTEDRIIKGMVGRELTNRYPVRRGAATDRVVLEVEDWNVYHTEDSGRQVLKDVSLTIHAGEIVGLAGLMGAGRTELAMSIFGREYGQKISGELRLHQRPVKLRNVKEAIANRIAYTSEDRKTYGLILMNDIRWNMTLAALKHFFSRKGVVKEHQEIVAAEQYQKRMNIKRTAITQPVGSLSGGNQQKVVLAKWMMTQPEVLILDEPTRGIDVGAKYEIYRIIQELADDGKAVLVISSEMPEIIGICDRVYVLDEGEIVGELCREELSQEKIMQCILHHNNKEEL